MPPRKHKLDEEEDADSTSPSSNKIKTDSPKVLKSKTEKKVKSEKSKKEKSESRKAENSVSIPKVGKDGKEKVVALHGDEAMQLMINYLKDQNRPYSATEISANLHGKVGKVVADKLLKEMSELGKIKAKSTKGTEKGSQWIFWALQDATDNIGPEELNQMDDRIQSLKEDIKELKIKLNACNKSLEKVKCALPTTELSTNIEILRAKNDEKKEKLDGYKSGQNKTVTRSEMLKVDQEFMYWKAKQSARKRAFQCLEDLFLESKRREDLWEEAGIEEDTFLI